MGHDPRLTGADQNRVAITGASGFVGAQLVDRFEHAGWSVTRFTRAAGEGAGGTVRFRLADEVNPDDFRSRRIAALVHCAYDFGPVTWSDIRRVNVEGSRRLMAAARAGGVETMVVISTISAFAGCRSLYGRAKLEIEAAAADAGAFVVRPGLVYGDVPTPVGGMFGSLMKSVRAPLVPLIDGGVHPQYLVHVDDLFGLVSRLCAGDLGEPAGPIVAASSRAWPMRELLRELARRQRRAPRFIGVPWQAVWAGLKLAELARLRLGYRSDSVVSLVHQDPRPDFGSLSELGVGVRDFSGR
ncbi:NAD-dependent epimerase/dehydratase family protein [bacterium]|nr:MAG: NAD-dependent epimerase/dehydratase family protein [bacterium]